MTWLDRSHPPCLCVDMELCWSIYLNLVENITSCLDLGVMHQTDAVAPSWLTCLDLDRHTDGAPWP